MDKIPAYDLDETLAHFVKVQDKVADHAVPTGRYELPLEQALQRAYDLLHLADQRAAALEGVVLALVGRVRELEAKK